MLFFMEIGFIGSNQVLYWSRFFQHFSPLVKPQFFYPVNNRLRKAWGDFSRGVDKKNKDRAANI